MTLAARQSLTGINLDPLPEVHTGAAGFVEVATPSPKVARPDVHLPFVFEHEALFADYPKASYFVGLVAAEGTVYMPETFFAARRLRFDTYKGYGLLNNEDRDIDGGEHDDWDLGKDSAQFAVLKNTGTIPKLIAFSRLLLNRSGNVTLPSEEDYPEAFPDGHSGPGSTESSRLTSMSTNRKERSLASAALQRTMIGWGVNNGFNISYAMVDERVTEQLDKFKIPFNSHSDYKFIHKYNSASKVISIDPEVALREASLKNVLRMPLATSLFFNGVKQNQGLGYYGANLVWRYCSDVELPKGVPVGEL